PAAARLRNLERLAQRSFDPVIKLVHPRLQPLVFVDQCVASQNARHSGIFFGESEKHARDLRSLCNAVGMLTRNAVDEREERRFDELDQSFEHLRLAREMAIERSLRNIESSRKCGGRYLLVAWSFQHRGKRLQNLQP